jgi:hypothetical protein
MIARPDREAGFVKLIQTSDRRVSHVERRRCPDRRATGEASGTDAQRLQILRELLDEAHARIRLLERAIEGLRKFLRKRR